MLRQPQTDFFLVQIETPGYGWASFLLVGSAVSVGVAVGAGGAAMGEPDRALATGRTGTVAALIAEGSSRRRR